MALVPDTPGGGGGSVIIRSDTVRPANRSADYATVYGDPDGNTTVGKIRKDTIIQVYADVGTMIKFKFEGGIGYITKTDVIKGSTPSSSSNTGNTGIVSEYDFSDINTDSNAEYYDPSVLFTGSGKQGIKEQGWKIMQAFGAPPKFNMDIDIQYLDEVFPGYGRVTAKTIMSNPSILSICPGAVDFLPGFSKKEKDNFFDTLIEKLNGANADSSVIAKIKADKNTDGKLYTFKTAFREYCKVFNVLCRACSIMLGIGDELMPNTSIKLKEFDYGYWQLRDHARASNPEQRSIFKDFYDGLIQTSDGAVSDSMYMHYFITNSETNVSETATTSTEESMIGQIFNNSELSTYAKNLNYLFGGPMGGTSDDLEEAVGFLENSNLFAGDSFLSKIGRGAINYVKGGRMIIPLMLGDVNYDKAINCSLTFMSPYGDPKAVFLNCMVGVMSLMAFALPKQLTDNMYTYPFIVRCYQKGCFNTDLAVISDLRIQRGGNDETSFTQEGLATEWTVNFSVVPLYSELMVTSSDHPYLFMKNEGLLEYLGNLCGLDLKANNLSVKMELAIDMAVCRFKDIPSSLGRNIGEMFANRVSSFFQFVNS